jgi:quinol-cytochrome oxidoreductase complex cytochrome b subunit
MKQPASKWRRLPAALPLLAVSAALSACAAAPASSSGEPLTPGEALYRLVVGGPSISEATLLRFYAWHVMGLAIPMAILIAWHGFRVRRDGGVSSPDRAPGDPTPQRTGRESIVRREWLTFFLTLAALIAVSVFVEPPIGPSAEPGALVDDTHAPWIFLWVQELLRVWPPAIAGVLTPLVVLLLLTLLPYFDWSNEGVAVWFNRQGRIVQIVLGVLFIAIIVLTISAALRP